MPEAGRPSYFFPRSFWSFFRLSRALPNWIGSHSCRVFHRDALDPHEALTEVSFFVRAWAGGHAGVVVEVQLEG